MVGYSRQWIGLADFCALHFLIREQRSGGLPSVGPAQRRLHGAKRGAGDQQRAIVSSEPAGCAKVTSRQTKGIMDTRTINCDMNADLGEGRVEGKS